MWKSQGYSKWYRHIRASAYMFTIFYKQEPLLTEFRGIFKHWKSPRKTLRCSKNQHICQIVPWPLGAWSPYVCRPGAEGHRFGLRGSNDQRQLHRIGQVDGSALRMDRGIGLDRCVTWWKSCKAIDETHQLVDSGYSGTVLFYLLGAIKIRKSPTRRNSVFLEFGR